MPTTPDQTTEKTRAQQLEELIERAAAQPGIAMLMEVYRQNESMSTVMRIDSIKEPTMLFRGDSASTTALQES